MPIEPNDICTLLNALDLHDATSSPLPTLPVARPILRELVEVWLRVAGLHEMIEMNPGLHEPDELDAVRALLFGVPELKLVPTRRCQCGAEWPAREPDFPNLRCPNCGQGVH